ncbi:hypothetical protein [Streptomyces sp. NPDC058086]|uniref:hypothetical protein n=1 Tax=Streptomyces sp. NPDC058086 TaxID=3346334 RepID=UPI0036E3AB76
MNPNPFRQAAADTMSAAACGVRAPEWPSTRGALWSSHSGPGWTRLSSQWLNAAQQDKVAAQKKLDALPTLTRKKESPLDAQQIREITDSLGDIAQRIHTTDADKKGPLYEALSITIGYERAKRTATVRSRPSSPYRQ